MQGCTPCMSTNERLMEPEVSGSCLMPPPSMQSYGTLPCILFKYLLTRKGHFDKSQLLQSVLCVMKLFSDLFCFFQQTKI